MNPVVLTDAAGIDDMREVILAVRDYEVCVRDRVIAIRRSRLCRHRDSRLPLDCLNGSLGPGEAGESSVEGLEPAAQDLRSISGWISRDKNRLHLIRDPGREFLQCGGERRHMHRTLIRTERVAEEEERDIALRLLGE